jgi:coproporphyrinogen III oxidase-like Fe-S oxidoreductase
VLKRDYDYDLTTLPGNPLLKMANQNLITLKADTVLLTRAGKLVADQLAMEFFASEK